MSRRNRVSARQRVEKRQREQEALHRIQQEPDELERERLLARHEREVFGYVRVGLNAPHYLRHLGLKDVTPSPVSKRHDPMPDVTRTRK